MLSLYHTQDFALLEALHHCSVCYIKRNHLEERRDPHRTPACQKVSRKATKMKGVAAALLTLALAAATCSAHVLSQDAKPIVGVDVRTEKLGKELEEVGHILVNVANVVGKSDESDAYMFGDLWHMIKTTVKETSKKFTDAAKDAVNDVKQTLQKAAEKAKQRAQEKAFEILARIMGDSMAAYAVEDSSSFRKDMCTKIERVGKKLIAEGQRLSRH